MELATRAVGLRAARGSAGRKRKGGEKAADSGNVGNGFIPRKMHYPHIELC